MYLEVILCDISSIDNCSLWAKSCYLTHISVLSENRLQTSLYPWKRCRHSPYRRNRIDPVLSTGSSVAIVEIFFSSNVIGHDQCHRRSVLVPVLLKNRCSSWRIDVLVLRGWKCDRNHTPYTFISRYEYKRTFQNNETLVMHIREEVLWVPMIVHTHEADIIRIFSLPWCRLWLLFVTTIISSVVIWHEK